MAYSKLDFGRHAGKTLPQIIFSDPDWFFWAWDQDIFKDKGILDDEAEDLYWKARNIRIPGENMEVEYFIHRPTIKFSRMQIVPATKPEHQGSSPAFRKDRIDLVIPRRITKYDKLGCKNLIHNAKYYLFGSSHIRLTRKRCDEFFENMDNFLSS
ncbi:MAG: hypothetical protein AB2L14_13105 [Candidatus Xenobiia bacterium LiM19]